MNTQAFPRSDLSQPAPGGLTEGLFEQAGWFYAFLRRRVFRDDLEVIARALRLGRRASGAPVLLEVGCGPGFYACRLAGRFPRWRVLGLDRSHDQIRRAQAAAGHAELTNCRFKWGNALALDLADASVDGLFASRLFTVLGRGQLPAVLAEMHRVLKPGGRCFVAEPRSRWRAGVSLLLLRLAARLAGGALSGGPGLRRPTVLSTEQFHALLAVPPWADVRCWEDGHYQYALAVKRPDDPARPAGAGQGGADAP